MPTRGRRTPLTATEGIAVLTLALGIVMIVLALAAKLGFAAVAIATIVFGVGVALLAYRMLRGRPRRPDGALEPPYES